mgnify:CR=1 FL=1
MAKVGTLCEDLDRARCKIPPYLKTMTFKSGFWWLMTWYLQEPENNQVGYLHVARQYAKKFPLASHVQLCLDFAEGL